MTPAGQRLPGVKISILERYDFVAGATTHRGDGGCCGLLLLLLLLFVVSLIVALN